MVKKTDQVRLLVAGGEFKKALSIAKGFRLGITKEQFDAMTLAYECMVHGRFYESLGYDLECKVREGVEILKELYGRSEEHDLYQQIQQSGA